MTRTSPPQVAFSAGEIDPLLHSRFDYQRFQTGLATCRGFVPLPQGGFTRAPGTTYLGAPKANACILIPFQFAADDAVVLEFTPGTMRVWRYGQLVLKPDLSGPYELATPYDANSLPKLRWVQSADVIYMVDGIRPMQRLSRFSLNNWTIADQVFSTGPFRVQNLDKARTIRTSGTTGTITLTSNTDLFTAGHVGGLMQLRPFASDVPLWITNATVNPNDLRRVGRKVYRSLWPSPITTVQGAQPIHDEGREDYGEANIWEYVCDDVGVVRITDVSSPTVATAVVLRELEPSLVVRPSYRWSEGAWNGLYGYPSSIEIFDQRLCAAATISEPRSIWFSTVGAYTDFLPSVEPDGSFAYTLAGSDSQNRITGLRRGRSGLHIFALSEEYSTRSDNRAQVIGPTTAIFGLDGSTGARSGRAIAPGGDPMFISRDGRKLYQVRYDFQSDANRELNLSRASPHFGDEGFAKVVWQQTPEPRAWVLRESGDLAVMIFDPAEEILGWSSHSVGGKITDICVTQNENGTEDLVYLVVERSNQFDTPITSIEQLDFSHHLMMARVIDQSDPETPFSTITVPWLSGFNVIVDMKRPAKAGREMYSDFVPETGVMSLPAPAITATVGIFVFGHMVNTLNIQAAAPDGNSLGRLKRLHSPLVVAVHETEGGRVRVVEHQPPRDGGQRLGNSVNLRERDIAATVASPYTGPIELQLPSGMARAVSLFFEPEGNARMTITGIVPTIQEAGR